MDAISTSAASGMRARMESLEMLANNLANVETGGFKADREFFSLYTSDDATADPQTGDFPTLPLVETHWTDLTQGNLTQHRQSPRFRDRRRRLVCDTDARAASGTHATAPSALVPAAS